MMVTPKDGEGAVRYTRTSGMVDAISEWAFTVDEVMPDEDDVRRPFPVAIELLDGSLEDLPRRIAAFVALLNKEKKQELQQPLFRLAGYESYAPDDAPRDGRGGSMYCVLTDRALFDLIDAASGVDLDGNPLKDFKVLGFGSALPPDALGKEEERPAPVVPNKPPKKGLVITAVIDTGIPFLNKAFCDTATSTRVRYAWVQDGKARPVGQFVPYGREFDRSQINTLLVDYSTGLPVTDELAAYRDEFLADFTREAGHPLGYSSTHGGYVGGAAAGYPLGEACEDDAIIFVQLPDTIVADSSGTSLEPYFCAAVEYIIERADRIAQDEGCGHLPVVINFSFGGTGGPLDGTSEIERYMDWRIWKRNQTIPGKTAIVLPAGNSYLSQCHALLTQGEQFKGPGDTEVLTWQIQPDDHTASIVEIWTPERSLQGNTVLEVGLNRPYDTGAPVMLPETPNTAVDLLDGGSIIARVAYTWQGPPTNRGKFTIIAQATAKPGANVTFAPSGPWKITVKDVGLKKGDSVDAWILRDDELPRFDTDARQSRFTDPRYVRWTPEGYPEQKDQTDCPIKRERLQNVIATGKRTIVMGGYVEKSGRAAMYTAGGPIETTFREAPDAMTVSDDSVVHWGVLSNLVLSGGTAPANGTSMSVPALVKALAKFLKSGDPNDKADRAQVAQWALASEASDFAGRAPQPPVVRSGRGRIELEPQNNRRYQP